MKKIIYSAIVILILISFINNVAFAKLLVLPPKLMIKCSNLIIVGNVVSLEKSSDEIKTKIHIQRIIKGKTEDKDLNFLYRKDDIYGFLHQFAPKGKVVMILLRDGYYTADKNNVAIINNGKLNILDGNPVGNYSVKDFEREYKKIYDKR
jgi:hypothetical protein